MACLECIAATFGWTKLFTWVQGVKINANCTAYPPPPSASSSDGNIYGLWIISVISDEGLMSSSVVISSGFTFLLCKLLFLVNRRMYLVPTCGQQRKHCNSLKNKTIKQPQKQAALWQIFDNYPFTAIIIFVLASLATEKAVLILAVGTIGLIARSFLYSRLVRKFCSPLRLCHILSHLSFDMHIRSAQNCHQAQTLLCNRGLVDESVYATALFHKKWVSQLQPYCYFHHRVGTTKNPMRFSDACVLLEDVYPMRGAFRIRRSLNLYDPHFK